jgi:two-component sensor histidine kinase
MGRANSDDYKRQQDLLFQEIRDMADLAAQAKDAAKKKFFKSARREIEALARAHGVTTEEYQSKLERLFDED